VIEITERTAIKDYPKFRGRLKEFRDRGYRFAVDDAGSGYAGLRQLIAVAPDILKLDRALVRGAHADPAKLALLEAMISFASSTGAAVCGEGIEELEDLRALAALDATYAQGYALARPAPAWPALDPDAAAIAADRVHMGVRMADAGRAGTVWSHRLAQYADHLALVDDLAGLATAGEHAARLLGADEVALMRVNRDDALVELLSANPNFSPGSTWPLSEFPATKHLLATGQPGQVVEGDVHGDPAELEELRSLGMGAMLMVPMPLGRGDGMALVEVYRRRPQAFSRTEIERARVMTLQLRAVLARIAAR
jgi:hypothetical protein